MNIHFFNSFKYPDSEQSFCNHDEGSHYSTPHFIYWSSSADITTCRAYIFDGVLIVVALGGETTPLLQGGCPGLLHCHPWVALVVIS